MHLFSETDLPVSVSTGEPELLAGGYPHHRIAHRYGRLHVHRPGESES